MAETLSPLANELSRLDERILAIRLRGALVIATNFTISILLRSVTTWTVLALTTTLFVVPWVVLEWYHYRCRNSLGQRGPDSVYSATDEPLLVKLWRLSTLLDVALVVCLAFDAMALLAYFAEPTEFQQVRFDSPLTPRRDSIDHFDIKLNHRFDSAKVEWFVALCWAIGIVGAVWAVLAKLKADMAFLASERASSQSFDALTSAKDAAESAQKAFHAASTKPIDFETLVSKTLPDCIEEAETSIRALLGIPQVGYFFSKDGTFPFAGYEKDNAKAAVLASRLLNKAERLLQGGGDFGLLFFDDGIHTSLQTFASDAGLMPGDLILALDDAWKGFVESTDRLKNTWAGERCRIAQYGFYSRGGIVRDPGLRVVIIDRPHGTGKRGETCKAVYWFVSDFVANKSPTAFNATAMETRDPATIELFARLIDDYLELLKSPTTSAPSPTGTTGSVVEVQPVSVRTETPAASSDQPVAQTLCLRGSMRDPEMLRWVATRSQLLYLMLNLPFSCNYHCVKCCNTMSVPAPRTPVSRPQADMVARLLDSASACGTKVAVIAGEGEPLLDSEFRGVVEAISGRGLLPYVFSNGSRLGTDGYAEFLSDHGASLIIGMDSIHPVRYPRLTGKADSLDSVLSNIDHCRKVYAGLLCDRDGRRVTSLAINMVVNAINCDEVDRIREFCGDDIVFVCNQPTRIGRAEQNWSLLYGESPVNPALDAVVASISSTQQPLGTTQDGEWCAYMRNGVSVSADGQVLTCAYSLATAGAYAALDPGNLTAANSEVMSSVREFYREHGHSRCILRHPEYQSFLSFLADRQRT